MPTWISCRTTFFFHRIRPWRGDDGKFHKFTYHIPEGWVFGFAHYLSATAKHFALTMDFDNEIKDYIHSSGHLITLGVIPKMVFGLTSEYALFLCKSISILVLIFLISWSNHLMLTYISSSKTLYRVRIHSREKTDRLRPQYNPKDVHLQDKNGNLKIYKDYDDEKLMIKQIQP